MPPLKLESRTMTVASLLPLILLAAASEDAPPQPRPATPPGSWISAKDYPIEALSLGSEGVTAFSIEVDAAGKASQCRVTQSSGSALLDAQTCRLAQLRARFVPGRPGTFSTRVRWVMPLPRAFEPGRMVVRFLVGEDGTVERCEVVERRGSAPEDPCASRSPRFLPFTDGQGRAVRRWIRQAVEFSLEAEKK